MHRYSVVKSVTMTLSAACTSCADPLTWCVAVSFVDIFFCRILEADLCTSTPIAGIADLHPHPRNEDDAITPTSLIQLAPATAISSTSSATASQEEGRPLRFLLVDDSAVNRKIIRRMIETGELKHILYLLLLVI